MGRNSLGVLGCLCCVVLLCVRAFGADPKDSGASGDEATKLLNEFRQTPAILDAKALEAGDKDDEVHKLLKSQYNDRLAMAKADYSQLDPKAEKDARDLDQRAASLGLKSKPGSRHMDEARQRVFDSLERLLKVGLELYEAPDARANFLKEFESVCKKTDAWVEYHKIQNDESEKAIGGELFKESNREWLKFYQSRSHDLQMEVQLQIAKSKKQEKK